MLTDPTPEPEPLLDAMWEALAQDIHAHGYSVRDALAAHRPAIERATRQAPEQARDSGLRAALLHELDWIEPDSLHECAGVWRAAKRTAIQQVNTVFDRAALATPAPTTGETEG